MPMDWENIAVAVACRVQYEKSCGRGRLISEDVTRLALAEVVQSHAKGNVEAEFNHPDIPGNSRVDLLVRSPQAQNIEVAIEHKWVRATTLNTMRHWMPEIVADMLRLERLNLQIAQGCERALVVVGEVEEMRSKVWDREVRQGNGQTRVRVVDAIIQGRPASGSAQTLPLAVNLRHNCSIFRKLFKQAAPELYNDLPSAYQIQLVAHHRTKTDGVECAVWRVSRGQQQRVMFDANLVWPPV